MAQDRRAMIRAAEKMVTRGKLDGAIKQYRKVLQATPDDTTTLNRLGDLYVRLKKLDEAVEMFSQAAEHFTKEGFLVKAIAIFKKIIRLDPTRITIYETLADLYHRQGLRNEARSQYQVVADYYSQAKDSLKVRSIFERMVELEPSNPSHRVKLAELYCEAALIPEAMDQYQRIAAFMLEHGRVDEALQVYRGAFDLSPTDLGFLTDVVLHLVDNAQPGAAEKLLAEAIEKNPEAQRVREVTGIATLEVESTAAPGGTEPQVVAEAEMAPDVDIEDEVPSLADEAPEAGDEEAVSLESRAEDGQAAAEEEVVVLDLEDDAAGLPFAVDHSAVHGTSPHEWEIDLEELEEQIEAVPDDVRAAEPESAVRVEEDEAVTAQASGATVEPEAEEVVAEAPEAAQEEKLGERIVTAEELAAAEEAPEVAATVEAVADVSRAEELVSEAKVLASYGLDGKAADLCEQAVALEPTFREAFELLIDVHHGGGRFEAVAEFAVTARSAIGAESQWWKEMAERLLQRGYVIDADRIDVPEAEIEEITAETLLEEEAVPAEPAGPIWLEGGLSDEESFADTEEIFGEEDEFFDLAAELEQELRSEEVGITGELLPQLQEQSLEEIVEGFKRGVAETLSEEDYETHYNLGIAYREMGLVDEAIGEFQLAAKAPGYLVDCCSLLGSCFLEKGFPDLAIKWYERGLEAPQATENESLGLLYELGNLYLITGDKDVARKTFAEIYGINSNYRDVVAKLEELKVT
ncbi:MAG: tetratricopeptide repeat protein [Acidobacteriota bacterium]|nr:tetratricopeptide repeat protein [Acidobacteriota bacterium]